MTFARARSESNENQDDEFLSFALQISENRFKKLQRRFQLSPINRCSRNRLTSPGPWAEPWQAPCRPGRRQICTYIYDGGTSLRLLRDFSSHSTFHGKPSPRLDRLGVRWLSGSEPFTETHRRHCVTVSCRNNVKV